MLLIVFLQRSLCHGKWPFHTLKRSFLPHSPQNMPLVWRTECSMGPQERSHLHHRRDDPFFCFLNVVDRVSAGGPIGKDIRQGPNWPEPKPTSFSGFGRPSPVHDPALLPPVLSDIIRRRSIPVGSSGRMRQPGLGPKNGTLRVKVSTHTAENRRSITRQIQPSRGPVPAPADLVSRPPGCAPARHKVV